MAPSSSNTPPEYDDLSLDDKIDKLMNEIHGKGRFGCFASFALVLGMIAPSFWFYNIAYLTMQPKYKDCIFADPQPEDPLNSCIADYICSGQVVSY